MPPRMNEEAHSEIVWRARKTWLKIPEEKFNNYSSYKVKENLSDLKIKCF